MALEQVVTLPRPHPLAIGVGCRRGVSASAIVDLVRQVLDRAGGSAENGALFTIADKADQAALYLAAETLALPLVFLSRAKLAAWEEQAATRSVRVVALFGLPSIAETAALAGAGEGATLTVARMSADGVSCAAARGLGVLA